MFLKLHIRNSVSPQSDLSHYFCFTLWISKWKWPVMSCSKWYNICVYICACMRACTQTRTCVYMHYCGTAHTVVSVRVSSVHRWPCKGWSCYWLWKEKLSNVNLISPVTGQQRNRLAHAVWACTLMDTHWILNAHCKVQFKAVLFSIHVCELVSL